MKKDLNKGIWANYMRTFITRLQRHTLFFLLVFSSACNAANSWNGHYVYDAVSGNTVGGSVIYNKYKLNINGSRCLLTVDGYQTEEKIKCKAVIQKNILTVKFVSYANGSVLNEFGVDVYKVNDTLFNIFKKGNTLITKWMVLKPNTKLPIEGDYFNLK